MVKLNFIVRVTDNASLLTLSQQLPSSGAMTMTMSLCRTCASLECVLLKRLSLNSAQNIVLEDYYSQQVTVVTVSPAMRTRGGVLLPDDADRTRCRVRGAAVHAQLECRLRLGLRGCVCDTVCGCVGDTVCGCPPSQSGPLLDRTRSRLSLSLSSYYELVIPC